MITTMYGYDLTENGMASGLRKVEMSTSCPFTVKRIIAATQVYLCLLHTKLICMY